MLGSVELVQVPKLVVLSLVDQILTVNFTKLVVVPKDFNFVCDECFIAIVVSLDH